MPANLLLPNNTPSSSTPGSPADYVAQLTQKLQSAFSSAAWNRDCAHNQQKQQYDKSVKHTPYVSGDLVRLNDPTTTKQKLAPHWKGPFEILECLGSDVDSPGVSIGFITSWTRLTSPRLSIITISDLTMLLCQIEGIRHLLVTHLCSLNALAWLHCRVHCPLNLQSLQQWKATTYLAAAVLPHWPLRSASQSPNLTLPCRLLPRFIVWLLPLWTGDGSPLWHCPLWHVWAGIWFFTAPQKTSS